MIDITTYRQRIGGYSPSCKRYAIMDKSHRVSLKLNRNKFCSCGFYIRGGLRLSPNGFVTWCETTNFSTDDNVGLKLGHLMYVYLMLLFLFFASNVLLSEHYMLNCCKFFEMLPNFLSNYNNLGLPSVATV